MVAAVDATEVAVTVLLVVLVVILLLLAAMGMVVKGIAVSADVAMVDS
jgi:hypothetical protein